MLLLCAYTVWPQSQLLDPPEDVAVLIEKMRTIGGRYYFGRSKYAQFNAMQLPGNLRRWNEWILNNVRVLVVLSHLIL